MATFGEWISCAGIVPRCIGWRTLTQHSSPSRTKGQTPKGVAKKSLRAPFVGFTQPSKILKGAWQSAFKGSAAQRIGWRRAPGVRRGLASLRLTYFNAPKGWYLFLTASSGGIITLFFINPAVLGVNCHSERNTFSQNPHVARNFTQPYPHRWQYVLA